MNKCQKEGSDSSQGTQELGCERVSGVKGFQDSQGPGQGCSWRPQPSQFPSLATLTSSCHTGDLIVMQWTHQPTSLVHMSSPTPSRQSPLRTKGATATLRKTHSEQGPGGGLGWGRHSRVQGHREHSLEGR